MQNEVKNGSGVLAVTAWLGLSMPAAAKERETEQVLPSRDQIALLDKSIRPTEDLAAVTFSRNNKVVSYNPTESGPGPGPKPPEEPIKPNPITEIEAPLYKKVLGFISALTPIPFAVLYIPQVVRGFEKANRTSWGIWAVNDGLLALTSFFNKDPLGWLFPTACTAATCTIFGISLIYGEKGEISKLDKGCILLSSLGLAVFGVSWAAPHLMTTPPTESTLANLNFIANLAGCVVNALAAIPTIRGFLKAKALDPETASIPARTTVWAQMTPWILCVAGPALSMTALVNYSLDTLIQPICFIAVGAMLLGSAVLAKMRETGFKISVYDLFFAKRKDENTARQ